MRHGLFLPGLFFVAFGCSEKESTPPSATISSPADGDRYYADQKILFEGFVSADAVWVGDLSVVWKSDLDGELAWGNEPDSDGTVVGYGTLSEGDHALSLTATDPDGLFGRDTVLVSIRPANRAPTCSIVAPPEGSAWTGWPAWRPRVWPWAATPSP